MDSLLKYYPAQESPHRLGLIYKYLGCAKVRYPSGREVLRFYGGVVISPPGITTAVYEPIAMNQLETGAMAFRTTAMQSRTWPRENHRRGGRRYIADVEWLHPNDPACMT